MARSCAIRQVRHRYSCFPVVAGSIASPTSSPPSSSSPSSSWAPLFLGSENALPSNNVACSLRFSRGSAFASGYSALTRKTLDSIMKLESVKDASPEDLTTIWNEIDLGCGSGPAILDDGQYFSRVRENRAKTISRRKYHIGRGHISAVMGSQLFDLFQQRASSCPLFVIPVRRGLGYITLLLQAQMPYLLFTGLTDYKSRGSDATPYLTVTHYTEFAETKGLVLVRGDVVFTSKLSDKEARAALEAAHSFYLNTSRYRLVTTFNKDSQDFEFRDVLRELNMSAGP